MRFAVDHIPGLQKDKWAVVDQHHERRRVLIYFHTEGRANAVCDEMNRRQEERDAKSD